MCTTTSSSGGDGGGSGGGGGVGGGESHQSVVSSCMFSKKTKKKQKVPRRGPGVAELEKILRQEDRKPSSTAPAVVSLSPPPTRTLFSVPSPPRSQLYTFLPQPTTSFPGQSSSVTRSAGFQFPFSNPMGSSNNGASSLDHQMQRNQQPSYPTMMNFFPSSSSSGVEPPSNQSRHFPDKPSVMIGGKRQCPFYIGDNTVAAETPSSFRFQSPSYLPYFSPRTNHDTDSRGNLVLLGCPTTTRERHSMLYNHPPQMQQRSVEAYASYEGSMMNKAPPLFYSFLEEPAGIVRKGETELISEEEGDGIDLRLKL